MPKTLLLADDSVTIQKVVGISFASEDIVITTVDNGDDAIAKARELRPHIILADVVMPGKSGYEVCEAIKNDPNLRQTPVLLLTGTFEAFDEERAARAGAAGHVAKPFEAQTLVQRVKELLAAPPQAAPPPPPAPAPVEASADAQTDPELGSDQAFDFFDDDRGDLSDRTDPGEASRDATLDLDEPEAAFAFGDEDLAVATQEPVSSLPLGGPERSADATVVLPPEKRPGQVAPSEEAADAAFDFGLDDERGGEAPVGTEDLAEATLLDPAAGSGFDVSSSDLAPSGAEETQILASARGPAAEAASEPFPPPRPSDSASSELHLAPDPVIDRLSSPPEPNAGADEGAVPASSPLEMRRPFGVERPRERDELEAEPVPAWPDAAEDAEEDEPLSLEPEPDDAPFVSAGRPEEAEVSFLSPAVRQELHATLERIAWDAFGPVTEKIVQQALERIEQVAWEVVPKLAETLIQEEIRRLKGDS